MIIHLGSTKIDIYVDWVIKYFDYGFSDLKPLYKGEHRTICLSVGPLNIEVTYGSGLKCTLKEIAEADEQESREWEEYCNKELWWLYESEIDY